MTQYNFDQLKQSLVNNVVNNWDFYKECNEKEIGPFVFVRLVDSGKEVFACVPEKFIFTQQVTGIISCFRIDPHLYDFSTEKPNGEKLLPIAEEAAKSLVRNNLTYIKYAPFTE